MYGVMTFFLIINLLLITIDSLMLAYDLKNMLSYLKDIKSSNIDLTENVDIGFRKVSTGFMSLITFIFFYEFTENINNLSVISGSDLVDPSSYITYAIFLFVPFVCFIIAYIIKDENFRFRKISFCWFLPCF